MKFEVENSRLPDCASMGSLVGISSGRPFERVDIDKEAHSVHIVNRRVCWHHILDVAFCIRYKRAMRAHSTLSWESCWGEETFGRRLTEAEDVSRHPFHVIFFIPLAFH